MRIKRVPGLRKGLAVSMAAGLGVGMIGALGAGTASADPVQLKLKYDCTYPLIGNRSFTVDVRTDVPKKVQAGKAIPKFQIFFDAALGADTTEGLQAVDGASISAMATANATVTSPDSPSGLNVVVRNQMKKTAIPAEGAFSAAGYGEATGPQFDKLGRGKITLGDFALKVDVLKANGSSSALGTFDSKCTVAPGQNNTVAEFDVVNEPVEYPAPKTPPSWYPEAVPPASGSGTLNYAFNLKGSSYIKGPNGTVPLDGNIKVDVDGKTGAITGDLFLKKTSGPMAILGFLPVTAEVDFEQIGKTVGTYTNGEIKTASTMNIKLPSFKVFGAIPLGGGENCKTSKPSVIEMHSTAGQFFNPKKGGPYISDSYKIEPIQDCGLLTPILSIFAAQGGNTINLTLAP